MHSQASGSGLRQPGDRQRIPSQPSDVKVTWSNEAQGPQLFVNGAELVRQDPETRRSRELFHDSTHAIRQPHIVGIEKGD